MTRLQWMVLFLGLLLAACASVPPPVPDSPRVTRCLTLYHGIDQAVARYGITPSSPRRIDGFPYLRSNRFLASYRQKSMTETERQVWMAHLATLDRQARRVEMKTLPARITAKLKTHHGVTRLTEAMDACSLILQNHDLGNPQRFALLRERVRVPSDYQLAKRVIGLYPLTVLPVNYGIYRWHQETYRVFATPLDELPVHGNLRRFRPPSPKVEAGISTLLSRGVLGIPQLTDDQLDKLFARHAPVWEIDVTADFDLPGIPYWQQNRQPTVDPSQPVVYRYVSYTRWQRQVLLQLNYVIWFAKRPLTGPLDILGGALDGLIWRVTLDDQGNPLIYDTIHPCGCYHQFFPGPRLALRPETKDLLEPPLVPQNAPRLGKDKRAVVRIESGTHYIQRVYSDRRSYGVSYSWRPYQALYQIPVAGGGARSLFGEDGLVPGTARRERFLLWPMGIPSPGAMRERGHHATAFAGRRHFDDPHLLEKLFQPSF